MKPNINHPHTSALRAACLLALSLVFTTPLFAQPPYNFRYPQTAGLSIFSPQGKSITRLAWCNVASANSIQATDGSSDFHLTLTNFAGALIGSFRIGNPVTNEFCSAICGSVAAANTYLLCGTSPNNNMLVMRVDATGTVTWSREIVFGATFSNAVTILAISDPSNPGYVVVGNSGSEVAALRLNEAGNIIWARTYPMAATYLTNMVTDAIVHKALGFEKIVAITGNHITNTGQDIFRLNLIATTGVPIWQQSVYSNTAGHVFGNPQIANVGSGITTNDYRVIISFLQADSPLSPGFTDLNMFATDIQNPASIPWAHTYQKADMVNLMNNDLSRLGGTTAKLSALVTEQITPPFQNPAIVNIDAAGNLNYALSFNEGRTQYAHSIMPIENCGAGIEVFNAADANFAPSTDLQVIANDNIAPDCTTPHPWPHVNTDLVQTFVTINPVGGAIAVNYPVSSSNAGLANVFDCQDQPVLFKRGENNAQNEETIQPVYPNPANTHVTVTTGPNPETVNILNNLGQVVYTRHVQGTAQVDLSPLPAGYYTITYTTPSGNHRQEKLVIRH